MNNLSSFKMEPQGGKNEIGQDEERKRMRWHGFNQFVVALISLIVVVVAMKKTGDYLVMLKENRWCCYYDQHYHQCYTGQAGCDLGPAIEFVAETDVRSSTTVVQCSTELECPAMTTAGYFVRGFRWGCPECKLS